MLASIAEYLCLVWRSGFTRFGDDVEDEAVDFMWLDAKWSTSLKHYIQVLSALLFQIFHLFSRVHVGLGNEHRKSHVFEEKYQWQIFYLHSVDVFGLLRFLEWNQMVTLRPLQEIWKGGNRKQICLIISGLISYFVLYNFKWKCWPALFRKTTNF